MATTTAGLGLVGLAGVSGASAAPAAAAPAAATSVAASGAFQSVAPTRLLDTRSHLGGTNPTASGVVALQVLGRGPIPASGVASVVLNITVTAATNAGYITAYADGTARPTASNLNFNAGQTVPNLVVAPVGANGKIDLYNGSPGTVALIADVEGYYLSGTASTAGAFQSVAPTRLLDTRSHLGGTNPTASGVVALQVLGRGPIPASGVASVVLNITVTAATNAGYITAYADGTARPTASNLNFNAGQTVPNLVVAPVGANGKIDLYNGSPGTVALIADVEGYYLSGTASTAGAFQSVAPTRLLDTRSHLGGTNPTASGVVALQVLGRGPIPASGVASVVLNITVTAATNAGYITAYADGTARPTASNLNFNAGQTVPNLVVAPVGANGKIDLYNGSPGTVALIADVEGYTLKTPPASSLVATPSTTTSALSWTNPNAAAFAGVIVVRKAGAQAPNSVSDGTTVLTTTGATLHTFADSGLTPGTQYSYAVFAYDALADFAAPTTATTTTLVSTTVPGPIEQRSAANVTADALPTAQIDGVAWAQVIVGNTVYVGGSFAHARPAGVALGGPGTVTRTDLLAYNLQTGVLISSFAPTLNGQVLALAASPDGTTLYAGGDFTSVNGVVHNRLVAFNTATGAVISSFTSNLNSGVKSVVATNAAVYAGGLFTLANGVSRTRLAAFQASSGALTSWAPKADYTVDAMVLTPDGTKMVIGGAFNDLNGVSMRGIGAVSSATGASVPWATNQSVYAYGTGAAILSLATDGTAVYGTAYNYQSGTGNLEGAFSVNPITGKLNWLEDCHGDTYGVFPVSGIVYTVSHAHYCANDGGWSNLTPETWRHSLAFTAQPTGVLLRDSINDTEGYPNHAGTPAPSIIDWFPDFTTGTYTGQSQAAWSVTGDSQYVVEGGEFPSVNNTGQQGLVRFAVPSIAPNAQGPRVTGVHFVPTLTAVSTTSVRISFASNWDRDDKILNYEIVRDGDTANPVWASTASSEWWNLPTISVTDTGLTPGTTYTYRLYASDSSGNVVAGDTKSITTPS